MGVKRNIMLTGIVAMLATCALSGETLYEKMKPSNKVKDLHEYYGMSEADNTSKAVLVLENEVMDNFVIINNGEKYIDYNVINEYIDNKFYFDKNEDTLMYTTPTEVIKAKIDASDYSVNDTVETSSNVIARKIQDVVYISLSFIEKYSNIDYKYYENPNRMVVRYRWDEEVLKAVVAQETQIRCKGNKHSDILVNAKVGEELFLFTDETNGKGYTKVATAEGIVGYILDRKLKEPGYKKQTNNFEKVVYPNINKGYVNLAWCAVTNADANSKMTSLLNTTQKVTAVSPTWLTVSGNDGSITSLCSKDVVTAMHDKGVEVWALIDDFHPDVSVAGVLAKTTTREALIQNIMDEIIKNNIDGINIDFEYVTEESSKDYLQFIRELSVKCRANNKVLSVDSYVYMSYNAFYYRGEVSEVADYVVIMGYDEHHKNSENPGSVASITWTSKAIKNSIEDGVAPNKLVIGMPFYTRLWEIQNGAITESKAISMQEQSNILTNNNLTPTWDNKTQQNYVEYTDDGKDYQMWMEDSKSLECKLKMISQANVGGIAFWRLGYEESSIWDTVAKYVK